MVRLRPQRLEVQLPLNRKPVGRRAQSHHDVIMNAAARMAHTLAFYGEEFATAIDEDQLDNFQIEDLSRKDLMELIERSRQDPVLKARLDDMLSQQLAPLIQQAIVAPPQNEQQEAQ